MGKGVEFSDCHWVDFVELGGDEQDGAGLQFPALVVERQAKCE